jgi:hypothetical protein
MASLCNCTECLQAPAIPGYSLVNKLDENPAEYFERVVKYWRRGLRSTPRGSVPERLIPSNSNAALWTALILESVPSYAGRNPALSRNWRSAPCGVGIWGGTVLARANARNIPSGLEKWLASMAFTLLQLLYSILHASIPRSFQIDVGLRNWSLHNSFNLEDRPSHLSNPLQDGSSRR